MNLLLMLSLCKTRFVQDCNRQVGKPCHTVKFLRRLHILMEMPPFKVLSSHCTVEVRGDRKCRRSRGAKLCASLARPVPLPASSVTELPYFGQRDILLLRSIQTCRTLQHPHQAEQLRRAQAIKLVYAGSAARRRLELAELRDSTKSQAWGEDCSVVSMRRGRI